jgi:hypothetical protein
MNDDCVRGGIDLNERWRAQKDMHRFDPIWTVDPGWSEELHALPRPCRAKISDICGIHEYLYKSIWSL